MRAGRTSPPRDEPRDLPRQKCATGETTTKKPPTRTKPPSHPAPAPPVPTGSDIGTSSPCPPPPNAICLTIPYEAHVGEKEIPGGLEPDPSRSSSLSRSCASLGADPKGANPVFLKVGSIVSRGVCGALGAADTVARALNTVSSTMGGDRRRDGRVVFGRSIDATAARAAGGATFKDSTDYEYDHSLASLCHLRDARVCGSVYGLQAAYNASHVAMTDAGKAAEDAYDAFEKAREVCDEFSAKADEMGAAMRAGKKVCRERARDASGDDLARALGAIKATLLDVQTGGGRCSRRAMYEQTKAARAAEIAAENKAGASHRDGKKIGKVVAVERTLEGGKAVKFGRDERSTTFVLPNGYVMPDEYFDECDKLSNSIDAMVAMLKPQTVKEHVCSEYTPGEVAMLKADAKRACASIAESKDAYALKLDAAKSLRSEVEARYRDLLDAEAAARGKTRTLDRLIATTAAAGGNDEAARELALSQAEERAAAIAAERAAPAPNSPESIADAAERIERTPAEKIGANDVVDVLRRFAGARAVVPPRVSKHIDAACAGPTLTKRASMRNVADMLEAFAAAKVVPGDKAREAMFAAIVREATRATPKAIAEVLHGLGSARGVGAGLQGADALTRRVVAKLAAAAAREAPKMDAREIADVLSSFGFAKPNKGLPGDARAALDAAVTREASRMSPEDVASVLVGYHRAGAAPEASGLLQKIAKFSDPSDAVDALAVFTSKRVKPAATTREALAKAVVNAAPAMRAGDVVKTLDAFADAGCAPMPPSAGDALGRAVLRLESKVDAKGAASSAAGAFGPEAIGDAIRAFRRAGVAPSNGVKDALARAAAREAPRFTPKNIAGTLEGYADAGESPPWSVVSACVDGCVREAANMDADEIADVVGAFASARVCGKLTATARSALDAAVAREAPRMYARDVASVARAYADCGEGAPGHGSVGPLLKAALETAASMHPTDARSTLAAIKRMGLGGAMDAKTRRALEAAAAATGEEANALRRSPTAKERREARRGGGRPGEMR